MCKVYPQTIALLKENQDLTYQAFSRRLIFTQLEIIGVKVPILRKMAKTIAKGDPKEYLDHMKYQYYEELLLGGLIVCQFKEEKSAYPYFKKYIEQVDNWAACDLFCSSYHFIKKDLPLYFKRITVLLRKKNPYLIRVGIVFLLNYYLTDEYIDAVLDLLSTTINHEHYYVRMALAWTYCEIYIRYPKKAKEVFENASLDPIVLKMTKRKILDSTRVDRNKKEKIKKLV